MIEYLIYLLILILIGLTIYLFQVVKRAAVEPEIQGKFPIKVYSQKRRYEVIWEERKFWVGLLAGLIVGIWGRGQF